MDYSALKQLVFHPLNISLNAQEQQIWTCSSRLWVDSSAAKDLTALSRLWHKTQKSRTILWLSLNEKHILESVNVN